MWGLFEALALMDSLQPELHARKYHVALGGSVLNKGRSDKDLDLYIFPFNAEQTIEPILPYLETIWGPSILLWKEYPGLTPDPNFQLKVKFEGGKLGTRRIDVFITKNGVTVGN